jgi:hypothetical protein
MSPNLTDLTDLIDVADRADLADLSIAEGIALRPRSFCG